MSGEDREPERFDAPPIGGVPEDAAVDYDPGAAGPASEVERVRRRHEPELLAIDGVLGLGVGRTGAGADAIVLYLVDEEARGRVPSDVEGVPIECIVTGIIEAYGG